MSQEFLQRKKVRITCALIFFTAFTVKIFAAYPFPIPKENELTYTTGVFNVIRTGKNTKNILLKHIDGTRGFQIFSCSYSPLRDDRNGSCGGQKYLEPFINNVVTIGWYETDEFLGFQNDKAQLVTIEMNGEMVRDYNHTLEDVSRSQKHPILFGIPLAFLASLLIYWLFGL